MQKLMTILILGTLHSASASSEDLLACVDPDVRQALVSQWYEEDSVISRSRPDAFEDLQTPKEFELIGSNVSSMQATVAFKTELEEDDAFARTRETLEKAEWRFFQNLGQSAGGFQASRQPQYATLCHDEKGMLTVIARSRGGTTYVNLTATRRSGRQTSCSHQLNPGRNPFGVGLSQYLPKLKLPKDAQQSPPRLMFGSMSGSNDQAETRIPLVTKLTLRELVDHFGQQIQAQGWGYDSGWAGELSAGTVWSIKPESDLHIVGVLEILSKTDASFAATFRASALD